MYYDGRNITIIINNHHINSYRFEMAPAGILHEDGGPVIQGRIPPRPKR